MFIYYNTIKKILIVVAILVVGFFIAKNTASSTYAKETKDIPTKENQALNLIKEKVQNKQDFDNVFKNGLRLKESDPKMASIFLEQAIKLEPKSRDAHLLLGYTCLKQMSLEKASQSAEVALKIDPINGATNYLLGKVYAAKGNIEQSQKFLQKAKEFGYNGK